MSNGTFPPIAPGEFRLKLATDPNYIVSFLLDNNELAVIDNLEAQGFGRLISRDQITEALRAQLASDPRLFVQSLNVRLDPTKLSSEEMAVLLETSRKIKTRGAAQGSLKSGPYGEPDLSGMTGDSVPGSTPSAGSAPTTEGSPEWLNIASSLGNLAVSLYGGIMAARNPPAPTQGGGGGGVPPKKENTWLLVGITIGAVVLVAIIIYIARKKSK